MIKLFAASFHILNDYSYKSSSAFLRKKNLGINDIKNI